MQKSVSEEKLNAPEGPQPNPSALIPAGIVQEQIWFQEEWTPKIGVYNIPTALRLTGPLQREALQGALNAIIERHESLRTCFVGQGSNLSTVLCEPEPIPLPGDDFSSLSAKDRERAVRQRLRCEARKPFDLRKDTLIRAALLRLAPQEHVLFINLHHIAGDEWSVRVLLRELKAGYEARAAGRQPELPELPIQYADYTVWQREQLDGGKGEKDLAFWKEELKGDLPRLEFPPDHPAAPRRTYEGDRVSISLGPDLAEAVNRFARESQTTPFTVLFAGWQALLARYTGQREILTGTAIAGRNITETEPLIGLFSNLLVLRNRIGPELTFQDLVAQVREKALNAYAHQDIPFDKVVAAVRPERDSLQMPLIQSVFTFQTELLETSHWDQLEVEWIEMDNGTSKFDLTATAVQAQDDFRVVLEFNTDLLERATIERFLGHYRSLLRAALAEPAQPIRQVSFLSAPERRLLLEDWNNTAVDYPRGATIHSLFEEQATLTPDAVAVVFGGETWTYKELNQRADELAATLRALGAGPEVMIGVCMKRSFELVLGLLAILKTGACYVPLDPDYPAERLEYMIRDARAPLLLTQTQLQHRIPETDARVIAVHETEFASAAPRPITEPVPVSAETAAYAIYTSGSTGRPKGVVVTHRNVVRLVRGANYAQLGPNETILQYAPISFDASTFEIWGALLTGGRLCIMPSGRASLEELADAISEYRITTLWLTTGLFNVMVDEHPEALRPLRQLLTGGEAGSMSHLRKFLESAPNCRLIHCYGPTENTTFTTATDLTLETLSTGMLPIGSPISNTQVYILDELLQPVPIGVPGELFTSGDGVARGYLNAPKLTGERFIPHPFREGDRLYRTGDLARWLPDGTVHYLGRLDRQVKVRGFRIELGEIERELTSHPGVTEAVIIAEEKSSAEKRLVAYWTGEGRPPSEEELREHLSRTLPEFMVPHVFLRLEKLPLDPNGKVDRAALPEPPTTRERSTSFRPPGNDLEIALAAIWQEALGISNIGLQDNFFHLGGHSLLATQIISRIRRTLHIEVPLRTIFDHPTLGEFADAAARQQAPTEAPAIQRRQSAAEAEELLARLDELSDEEVERLVRAHSS